MSLPEKNQPHLWKLHLEPTKSFPEEKGAPLKDLQNYSREKLSWEGL